MVGSPCSPRDSRERESLSLFFSRSVQNSNTDFLYFTQLTMITITETRVYVFNVYAEYIMRNAGLEEAQAGIKIAGRNIITSDMQMIPPLWQKVKRN